MSGPFANEDVMEEYLSALLTEDAVATDDQVQKQTVARLLEPVAKEKVPQPDTILEEEVVTENQ